MDNLENVLFKYCFKSTYESWDVARKVREKAMVNMSNFKKFLETFIYSVFFSKKVCIVPEI